jgi:hypothetical protein
MGNKIAAGLLLFGAQYATLNMDFSHQAGKDAVRKHKKEVNLHEN